MNDTDAAGSSGGTGRGGGYHLQQWNSIHTVSAVSTVQICRKVSFYYIMVDFMLTLSVVILYLKLEGFDLIYTHF